MDKTTSQLEKLQSLLELVDKDFVTEEDFVAALEVLKTSLEHSDEEIRGITESLRKDLEQFKGNVEGDFKTEVALIREQMSLLRQTIAKVKAQKGDPGEPGRNANPEDVATILKNDSQFIEKTKGIQGDPGEIKALSPEEIRDSLELLEDDERLDAKAIKNLPEATKEIIRMGGGGNVEVFKNGNKIGSSQRINFLNTNVTNGADGSIVIDPTLGGIVDLTSEVTGILPIANGGTNTSSQTTNGVAYFDGTKITTGSGLTFDGTNVGVNYGTPQVPLDISGKSDTTVLRMRQDNAPTVAYFTWKVDNAINGALSLYSYLSGTETLGLTQARSGNIGIGTTNPTSKLSIVQDSTTKNGIFLLGSAYAGGTGGSTDGAAITLGYNDANYGAQIWLGNKAFIGDVTKNIFRFGNGGALSTPQNVAFLDAVTGDGSAVADFHLGNGARIQIGDFANYASNIHIQTRNATASYTAVDILGASGQSGKYLTVSTYGGTTGDLFTLSGGGDVGIGTSSPNAKLDVAGNIYPHTDNTYYLGKNSSSTPFAWKGVILKDTTNGNYYRIEVINGVITATAL